MLAKNYQQKSIINILLKTHEEGEILNLWMIEQDIKKLYPVKIAMVKQRAQEIVVQSVNCADPKNEIKKFIGPMGVASFFLGKGNVIFRSEYKMTDRDGKHTFAFPDVVAIQDRRQAARYTVEADEVTVQFTKLINEVGGKIKKFNKRCFDLSSGGISFILNSQEREGFERGEVIENVVIKIEHKTYVVAIYLVNLIDIQPDRGNNLAYAGYKACFSFQKIDIKDKEQIENYVLSHIKLEKSSG